MVSYDLIFIGKVERDGDIFRDEILELYNYTWLINRL